MTIIDTYQEILKLLTNSTFDIELWEKYADGISHCFADKIKKDSKDYNWDSEIMPVIKNLFHNMEKFELAHSAFLHVTKDIAKKVSEVLSTDLNVSIVFYLGLCNGAGWATDLDGKKVVLLGIEKIVELDWCDERNMIALIYHELGHIWHYQRRTEPSAIVTQKDKALWQLYSEGMAMHIEQLLYGDADFYHQDVDGWLDWCRNNHNHLFDEYRKRMDGNESIQPFYGDWCQFEGHSDIGYYLGSEFIKKLSEKYSLDQLANLDMFTLEKELYSLG